MTSGGDGVPRRAFLGLAAAGLVAAIEGCSSKSSPATTSTSTRPRPSTTATPHTSTSTSTPPTLGALSRQLQGPLLRPTSAGYPGAARLYNPRFDSVARPAAIALCRSAADVAACVRFAAAGGLALRLRAGGHSYGGWSTGPGLVADVSGMSAVTVDTAGRTARIGAGAQLIEVYSALAARGVAIAAGSCPTVGITGLTLGGGIGVLAPAFGLTCDAVRSVEIVTADGRVREVDATTDADLYWALRGGGGGSFGAVTAFTMNVRPAPTVHTFFLSWDFAEAESVLAAWQRWAIRDSRLWSTCKLLARPSQASLRVSVAGTWIGPSSELQAQLAPLRAAVGAAPSASRLRSLSYAQAMLYEAGCSDQTAAECVSEALGPAKRQPFAATSAILATPLPGDGITAAVRGVRAGLDVAGMVEGGVSFDALGGAVADVRPAETAFVHRRALASMQYSATWASMSAGNTDVSTGPFDAFVHRQRAALMQWTGPSAYVNYADPLIADFGDAYWGANYPRLRTIKKRYDPDNVFTFPQSVRA